MVHDAAVEVGRGVHVAHQAEAHLDGGDLVGPADQLDLDVSVRRRHCLNLQFRGVKLLSRDLQLQVLAQASRAASQVSCMDRG